MGTAVLHQYRYLLTYLLTPWCRVLLEKLTGLQLVKKFPAFLWNPKVHYRTHKRPPPVPALGQPNPVHILTSHLLDIHPNIIHPSTPRSPQWSLSLRFPHQDPIRPPPLTHTRHMPSPFQSSRFCHPHNIGWGVQINIGTGEYIHLFKNFTSTINSFQLTCYLRYTCWLSVHYVPSGRVATLCSHVGGQITFRMDVLTLLNLPWIRRQLRSSEIQ